MGCFDRGTSWKNVALLILKFCNDLMGVETCRPEKIPSDRNTIYCKEENG